MIVVTGANGQLGRHIVKHLSTKVDPSTIVATARSVEKLADVADQGIEVRHLDYAQPDSISTALQGADQVMLVSSSEIGQRIDQHKAVIDAVVASDVKHLAYTSLLRADTSELFIAGEHKATEELLDAAGASSPELTTTNLRNGWYIENYTEMTMDPALENGMFIGAAGEGKISAATRSDYAEAAASVLADQSLWGQTYELAGRPFTMAELAAAVSSAAGKDVGYADMPAQALTEALSSAGLPPFAIEFLVDSDLGIAKGALEGDSEQLEKLIGRAPSTLESAISSAIAR